VYLKTYTTRGGYINNVTFSNLTLHGGDEAFGIIMDYGAENAACHEHPKLPTPISNIRIQDVRQAPGTQLNTRAAEFVGLNSNSPITNLSLENVQLNVADPTGSMTCNNIVNGSARNVTPVPCPELKTSVLEEPEGTNMPLPRRLSSSILEKSFPVTKDETRVQYLI